MEIAPAQSLTEKLKTQLKLLNDLTNSSPTAVNELLYTLKDLHLDYTAQLLLYLHEQGDPKAFTLDHWAKQFEHQVQALLDNASLIEHT